MIEFRHKIWLATNETKTIEVEETVGNNGGKIALRLEMLLNDTSRYKIPDFPREAFIDAADAIGNSLHTPGRPSPSLEGLYARSERIDWDYFANFTFTYIDPLSQVRC